MEIGCAPSFTGNVNGAVKAGTYLASDDAWQSIRLLDTEALGG